MLANFVSEAILVDELTKMPGYDIIKRDLENDISRISTSWATLDPKTPQFEDLRIHVLSLTKLLSIFDDYAENRRKAEELLLKLFSTKEEIPFDVDVES